MLSFLPRPKRDLRVVFTQAVLVVVVEEEAIAGVVGMTVVVAAAEALEPRARWKRGLETGTVHRKFSVLLIEA